MNCSDSMDMQNNYYVTPGWKSMQFAKPLLPGAKYRSYVKMILTAEDPTVYLGDVYVMYDDAVVGMVGGIQFRRYPRILLSRFFSPPDTMAAMEDKPKPALPCVDSGPDEHSRRLPTKLPAAAPPKDAQPAATVESAAPSGSIAAKALVLIAREAALEISNLEDDESFANLGIDSLISLVIVEKFRTELNVKVGSSLFLDYPTIGDLRKWLDEYYS